MLRAHVEELGARKATVRCSLRAGDLETVRARVVAVRVKSCARGRSWASQQIDIVPNGKTLV